MAELLIVVVVAAAVLLLYAADRARKLRARARQMAAMNDRLDAAAAKVDEQQERQQARVRASAELTSVLPAIKRPPLILPGVVEFTPDPGEAEPDGPAEAEAGPAAEAGPETENVPAASKGSETDDSPAAEKSPDPGYSPGAGARPAVADEAVPEPERTPEGTLTMAGGVIPDAAPVLKLRVTSEGTLIMPAVPGPAPAGAGESVRASAGESVRASEAVPPAEAVAAPAPPRGQAAASQRRADRA